MEKISSKFIEFFVSNDFIKNEDKEIYKYALNIILSSLIHIATVMVLGLCFNLLIESLVFYFAYIVIRKFSGGYHAKTPAKCYIFSVIITILVLTLLRFIFVINTLIINGLILFSVLICVIAICILSPQDNKNHPLTNKEKIFYKKIAVIISSSLFLILVILIICRYLNIGIPIAFGIYMSTVLLVMNKYIL